MVAAAIIALYFWTVFAKIPDLDKSITVNMPTIILAGITSLLCFISYLWPPKKYFFPIDLIIYLLLTATVATLIISTGGISSPFITLLMLVVVFSDIFGLWGALPILLAASAFTTNQFINNNLTTEVIIMVSFSSLLPLIASFIIWHKKSRRDESTNGNGGKDLHKLKNELNEVANKSEVVINAIGDAVIAIDSLGIVQLINPAAQNILGWSKQDALSLNYRSVLKLVNQKSEDLSTADDPINQALNLNQEIRTNDLIILTKSEKKMMVSLVASPISESRAGVIIVFHDITKEKAAEREQAEFISTASHEMRTPVASIEGYLGLALNEQTAQIDDRARDFIFKAQDAAKHLGNLFQDLLDASKADDGRLSNNPKVTDIIDYLSSIVQGMEKQATDKGLKIIYKPLASNKAGEHTFAPAYSANIDNDHLREVINNLIENAIKYTQKGEITVDVTGDDDTVTISIKDTGIGIPAEDMPHLFQKFYRVNNKDTRDIGGTGLGLYLCRRLVEIMGGRIWAESIYKSGSTFYIQLSRFTDKGGENLVEQQIQKTQQDAETPQEQSPELTEEIKKTNEDLNTVPRGEALTPEQIASYVAKQSSLAQTENKVPDAEKVEIIETNPTNTTPINNKSRSKSISIPDRKSKK